MKKLKSVLIVAMILTVLVVNVGELSASNNVSVSQTTEGKITTLEEPNPVGS